MGNIYTDDFEVFWKEYPRKTAKSQAYKVYCKLVATGVHPSELIDAAKGAKMLWVDIERRGAKFIPHPATFLGPREQWSDCLEFKRSREDQFGVVTKVYDMLSTYWPKQPLDETKVKINLEFLFSEYRDIEESKRLAYFIQEEMNRYLEELDNNGTEMQFIRECHNWVKDLCWNG